MPANRGMDGRCSKCGVEQGFYEAHTIHDCKAIQQLRKENAEFKKEIERLKGEYEKLARRKPACIDCDLPMGDIGLKPEYKTFPLKESPSPEPVESKLWFCMKHFGVTYVREDQCPKCNPTTTKEEA